MTVVLGSAVSAGGLSRLGGPEGPPRLAAIDSVHIPVWKGGAVAPGRPSDSVFVLNPVDEETVLAQGGVLHGDPLDYADPAAVKAVLGTGKYRRSVAFAATKGVYMAPVDGLFGLDQWTAQCWINPGGVEGSTLTSTIWTVITGGSQSIVCKLNGGSIFASISGNSSSVSVSLTITTGDVPASTWTAVWVTWNAATGILRVTLGDNVKTAASSAAINPAWLKSPFSGDPRIATNSGLVVAHNQYAGGEAATSLVVSDLIVYRYARVNGQQNFQPRPGITVDAATTQGAWPAALAGIVSQYTAWERSEAAEDARDPGAVERDAQCQLLADAGCPHVRIAEFSERAIPTISGGTVQSVNVTNLVTHLDRFLERGMSISMHVGFMPAALGGGTGAAGYVQPNPTTIGAANQAAANVEYARYSSMVFTALKSVYDGRHGAGWFAGKLKSLSFWNEPENQWSSGDTAFVDLWEATSIRHAADHPDLPALGGPDGSVDPGVRVRAAANGRPLGSWHAHLYSPLNLTSFCESIDSTKTTLAGSGFSSVKVQPTEWGMISSATSGGATGYAILAQEQPQRQESAWMAAFVHAFVYEMAGRGATIGAFHRIGKWPYSATAQSEEMMALMTGGSKPRPWPVFAAFELMWKMTGTRVSATVTYPHLRALATKDASGIITLVYSSFRAHQPREVQPVQIAWAGLPSTFTWKQWRVDTRDEIDGRPSLLDVGDQTDLPLGFDLAGLGVGCIQITPA